MNIDHALTDPEFFASGDPHGLWRKLRTEDPVHWTQGRLTRPFWSITRHVESIAVLRDPVIFSSEREGQFLPADDSMEGIAADTLGRGIAMISTDPPKHTAMRELLAGPYTPRAVMQLEERVRGIVREAFDEALGRHVIDLVSDIATKVPIAVICDMLDIPREDWPYILKLNNMIIGSSDPQFQDGSAGNSFEKGFTGLGEYGLNLAQKRRASPGTDTLSSLGAGLLQGRPFTDREIRSNSTQIIAAGFETTRNTFAAGVHALIERPDQMAKLRANRKLVNSAVEEILRYITPSVHTMRTAARDTEISGTKIREGDRIVIWSQSANRDELVFKDPDSFLVDRSPNPHISFGYGAHFCLGAHLAKLELRLMLSELLDRVGEIRLLGPVEKLKSNWIAGVKAMPVELVAAA